MGGRVASAGRRIHEEATGGGAPSLFDRLGGAAAVDAAVDLFYRKLLADARVSAFFDGVDMTRQARGQKAFLTMLMGGPNNYSGASLRLSHRKYAAQGLNDIHFDVVVRHLADTLRELGCAEADIVEVGALAESARDDVLNRGGEPDMSGAAAARPAVMEVVEDPDQFRRMLDDAPVNIMVCELEDLRITYANAATINTLRSIEHVLPIKADKLLGTSIDIFHKNPGYQRKMLADPRNLPHKAIIELGG